MTYKRFISCSGKINIHEYSFLGQKRQQSVHEMNMNPIPTSKADSQYGELAATIQPLLSLGKMQSLQPSSRSFKTPCCTSTKFSLCHFYYGISLYKPTSVLTDTG